MLQALRNSLASAPALFDKVAPRASVQRYLLKRAADTTKIAVAVIAAGAGVFLVGKYVLAPIGVFTAHALGEKPMGDLPDAIIGGTTLLMGTVSAAASGFFLFVLGASVHADFKAWQKQQLVKQA
jgi:hypothetical protein